MKKIIVLFAVAAASFLLFAYMEEYENLLMPMFNTESKKPAIFYQEQISENTQKTILDFNNALSRAYIAGDPSLLPVSLIDKELHAEIAQEITYLRREGKVMELYVKDFRIEEIRFISSGLVRVRSSEILGLRYLNADDKTEIIAYPDARQEMVYTVEYVMGQPKILAFEVAGN